MHRKSQTTLPIPQFTTRPSPEASITVVNRDRRRGGELADLVERRTPASARFVAWRGPYRVPEEATLVVNATPIGLFPDVTARPEVDPVSLRPWMTVADVVPNPPRTAFLRDAAGRGCATLDGLGMLVNQGAIGMRHWTGTDPDPAVLRAVLEDLFGPG